jgi:hypothetical protein
MISVSPHSIAGGHLAIRFGAQAAIGLSPHGEGRALHRVVSERARRNERLAGQISRGAETGGTSAPYPPPPYRGWALI